jgi:hypothetical protein
MFGLTRWSEPHGISRLRQDMDEMFDRFFEREVWMPGRDKGETDDQAAPPE